MYNINKDESKKSNKTLKDVREEKEKKYKTSKNTFDDFPIGTRVKIITPMEDFTFFYEEEGTVIENKYRYLGIKVEFDTPRKYEDGTELKYFNFQPESLYVLEKPSNKKIKNKHNIDGIPIKNKIDMTKEEILEEEIENLKNYIELQDKIISQLSKHPQVKKDIEDWWDNLPKANLPEDTWKW